MTGFVRLRAVQALLLLLLAAIALQTGVGASSGALNWQERGGHKNPAYGQAFRADTPDGALLPYRVDNPAADLADHSSGSGGTAAVVALFRLATAAAGTAWFWHCAALSNGAFGPYLYPLLPRAPPLF